MSANNTLAPTLHNDLITPLLTDNYQITMAYTYFLHGRHNDQAVFEAFFRKCPFGTKENPGQYTIYAGLEEVLKYLVHFKFSKEDIEYLREYMPAAKEEFFTYLENLDTSELKVTSIKEGTLVFPNEPLIVLEGPLGLVQLIETTILNLLNFPSLIATNANRMKREAGEGKICMEFGLRRAQGPDGALAASQYSFLGGFDGTSNVIAGKKFGIPVTGTMAHSFVTSYKSLDQIEEFELNNIKIKETALNIRKQLQYENTQEGELASFIAYAKAFPQNFVCLVDTYNVLESGIPNFLIVSGALEKAGYQPKGVRLDSGNLAHQSIEGKKLYKEVGQKLNIDTSRYIVVASNDINEDSLKKLNKANHQIDSFGIGTQLVTCSKQPALGMVYKLVSLQGDPKHKLVTSEPEKSTLPGKKTIYRLWTHDSSYPTLDIICKDEEIIEEGQTIHAVLKTNSMERYTLKPTKVEKILVTFMENGQITQKIDNVHEAREFCYQQKQSFNQKVMDNDKPEKYPVLLSEEYFKFFQKCNEKLIVYKTEL